MSKVYDPRMHSAEHILNRTMDRLFGCGRCFRAHIEKRKSKCDYRFSRDLTAAEIQEIETRVNAVVDADLPITETHIGREEAAANYNIARLPQDTGDSIRIVRVGDYDVCPCIGSHVGSTKTIGGFRISSSSFDDVLRIIFRLEGEDYAQSPNS
jgi:Ser-tRNA(Ala) deacylase AlaX